MDGWMDVLLLSELSAVKNSSYSSSRSIYCMYVFEALSIRKNFDYQSGVDVEEKILFRGESHVFAGAELESK